MRTSDLLVAFDIVTNDVPMVYDLTVTTPPADLIKQRAQDHYNTSKPESFNNQFKLSDKCKSIIYGMYSVQ